MEANCAQYDLTWSSWHTWCAKKTQVIFGRGAIWPSLGPLTRSNDSQDQLVVTMLFKNLHPRPVCGHHSAQKHANLCIHAYMHLCIHAFMHICIYAYMHLCIHAHMHTCIYAYMHTCTHVYVHTGIHVALHLCYALYNMLWVAGGICTLKV